MNAHESQEFLKSLCPEELSLYGRIATVNISDCPSVGSPQRLMLFLRHDQALELLSKAESLRERLIIRYFLLNGLSPMELSNGRVEHLDPISCTLFLPKRHWKRNCLADIDPETVRLQVMFSGDRTEGPLIPGRYERGMDESWLCQLVKIVALRTCIPGREKICPLILKRTFAREWLLSGGSVGSLQKQFSHKHLWSTAHYLRFVMEDVKPNHRRMVEKLTGEQVRLFEPSRAVQRWRDRVEWD